MRLYVALCILRSVHAYSSFTASFWDAFRVYYCTAPRHHPAFFIPQAIFPIFRRVRRARQNSPSSTWFAPLREAVQLFSWVGSINANVVPNMLCHPSCAGPLLGTEYRGGAVVVGKAAQRGGCGGVKRWEGISKNNDVTVAGTDSGTIEWWMINSHGREYRLVDHQHAFSWL